MKHTGLILEGGANRGVFTAGVLDCLQDYGIYMPYIAAVSAGSINAMDYISGQKGRSRDCMIPNGRNHPPIHWTHLLRKRSMIDFELVFDEYPNRKIPFDYQAYEASDMVCEYVATDCHTGEPVYLSEKHDGKRLMQIVKASCTVPYVCPMTELEGRRYVDGGISDSIPIRHAMERGYKKNIVVLTREKEYRKPVTGKTQRLARIMYHNYPEVVKQLETRNRRYNETAEYLEELEAEGEALVIRPHKVLVSRADNNTERLKAFYRQGYETAKQRIEEIKSFGEI
ncbi:patatin-like phospholipase family protein [Anaerostipes sp.]|uniref:patatin-like phospholipase family protein n=1 Tax=Anaerostipes sp. TaxID=1872530 RepID=UPI0025C35164|nr:patatin family protein [Anaerostipes sp.]MBS7008497.1 patatin family protein [Anaerostipes sp.]